MQTFLKGHKNCIIYYTSNLTLKETAVSFDVTCPTHTAAAAAVFVTTFTCSVPVFSTAVPVPCLFCIFCSSVSVCQLNVLLYLCFTHSSYTKYLSAMFTFLTPVRSIFHSLCFLCLVNISHTLTCFPSPCITQNSNYPVPVFTIRCHVQYPTWCYDYTGAHCHQLIHTVFGCVHAC